VGADHGAAIGRAIYAQLAGACGYTVAETSQAAAVGTCAADTVVAYLGLERAIGDASGNRGVRGVRVLRDVRERLSDDEVRGCFDGGRKSVARQVEIDLPGRVSAEDCSLRLRAGVSTCASGRRPIWSDARTGLAGGHCSAAMLKA
jgi:hypothetical protein